MAAISLTPFSPVRPWTTWTPLVLVVGVSMIKEAREDYKRYKQDKEVNGRPTRVLDSATGTFIEVPWHQVQVGDVVQVLRDEYLPADLVLLTSSNNEGTCYVETMNLDGETNLKIKAAPDETKMMDVAELCQLRASVECEGPNARLYQFTGNLTLSPPYPASVAGAVAAAVAAQALASAPPPIISADLLPPSKFGPSKFGPPANDADSAPVKALDLSGLEAQADAAKLAAAARAAATPASPRAAPVDGNDLNMTGTVRFNNTASPRTSGQGATLGRRQQSMIVTLGRRSASMFAALTRRGANLHTGGGREYVVPLGPSAMLLRGCSLRNTDYVYALVVYAGHDTKIFMNSTEAPSKRSHVEHIVDKVIMSVFTLLFIWCLTSAVYHSTWTAHVFPSHWYMRPDDPDASADPDSPATTGAVNFFVALLLYSYLVPISLYVSIEMVKVFQSMVLINHDRDMYHAETDTPAMARTSNLNEELGMVNTVLSDKTGTLTRNVMEFFKCSIAGVAYGAGITEIDRANALRKGTTLDETENPEAAQWRERFFNFYDDRLVGDAWFAAPDPQAVEMFFRLLAVCHTVIPDGPTTPAEIKYEAESPDEAALVVAAKAFGFFFHKRTNTTVTVREKTARGEQDVEYEVLNVLEFNSTRKRMSVVIRVKESDKLLLFTKGADTVIYERLDPAYAPNAAMKESTSRHMEEFGAAGLRTLCLSYAEVDRDWYNNTWQPEWTAAKTSLQDRDAKVAEVSEKIEKNLRLLGCTAIEDKLQEGVPECIKMLAMAGIRIWVLTGDKMETAINIAYACSLLTDEMTQYTVSVTSSRVEELERAGAKEEAEVLAAELVGQQLAKIEASLGTSAASSGKGGNVEASEAALVIDGKALSYALSRDLHATFLRVGMRCKAVVCCRVSPLQKAQVTTLVRDAGNITLAIGDGANDVGMIQRADIGVGISGQEGMQASMSADFSIAQFRFLVPLMLVHGQLSYKRLTRMICFFFYKNLLFAITLFTYSAFTTFSGSYIYNDTSMTLFNVVFTSATPLLLGMFDRPLSKRLMLRYPELYRAGIHNQGFNAMTIAGWVLSAVSQAGVILTLVLVGCRDTTPAGSHGLPWAMAQTGVVMFTSVVLSVHFHLVVLEEAWTYLHHIAIWGSIALWFIYLLAFAVFPVSWSLEMWHLFADVVAPNAQYWLYCLLIPMAAVMPCAAVLAVQRLLFPTDEDIIREVDKVDHRLHPSMHGRRAHAPDSGPTPWAIQPPASRKALHPQDSRPLQLGSGSKAERGSGGGRGSRNKVAPEPVGAGSGPAPASRAVTGLSSNVDGGDPTADAFVSPVTGVPASNGAYKPGSAGSSGAVVPPVADTSVGVAEAAAGRSEGGGLMTANRWSHGSLQADTSGMPRPTSYPHHLASGALAGPGSQSGGEELTRPSRTGSRSPRKQPGAHGEGGAGSGSHPASMSGAAHSLGRVPSGLQPTASIASGRALFTGVSGSTDGPRPVSHMHPSSQPSPQALGNVREEVALSRTSTTDMGEVEQLPAPGAEEVKQLRRGSDGRYTGSGPEVGMPAGRGSGQVGEGGGRGGGGRGASGGAALEEFGSSDWHDTLSDVQEVR
ncbi:hypothetical protein HYH03_002971 [Edaphochlamys debaryana]|uniref:Phospholipid-transporting ATPase n=1 Tax=Edaphochlamys debaryana TaxID=47281 RepID=A0A835YAL6_9CHLO|nr:hypothetical protein HYH03_002971 [Edaphochlamys debaryana]|eukprot:KAG2499397.1 hypothetical protein HYH03_002971 [Edaphochlamys debaryana]